MSNVRKASRSLQRPRRILLYAEFINFMFTVVYGKTQKTFRTLVAKVRVLQVTARQ